MNDCLVLSLCRGLQLPLAAVTTTEAIVGIRGSGKTNTAVVEAEELLTQGQQIVVIDPTDVWWGLKSSKSGEHAGFPVVILGGRHADLPLVATDGAVIADFVVDERASVILSLRHFESKSDVRRFITDFARRLYFRKGQADDPTPVKIFIDEASIVVPQRVMGEEAKMVGAIQQLVRQGRSSGIGVALIDQRPATINKDVLTQLELLIAHRITSPQDRKALVAWVEQHDVGDHSEEFLTTLAALEQGEAWFWSPGWLDLFKRVHVRERKTFDSSRTPKPGERVATPTRVAAVDLEALKAKLATSIEKSRADDPRELRKQLAERDRTIKELQREKGAVDPMAIAAAEQRGRDQIVRNFRELGADMAKKLRQSYTLLLESGEVLEAIAETMKKAIDFLTPGDVPTSTSPSLPGPAVPTAVTPGHSRGLITQPALGASTSPRSARKPDAAIADGVTRSEQKVLDALALMERLGSPGERTNLGFFAGYSDGGRFNNLLGALRTKGLIEYPSGGEVALTSAGRAIANADGAHVQSIADLHALWLSKLPASEGRVLRILLDLHPHAVTKTRLGEMTEYSDGGRFNNILGRLRSLGAIEYPEPGYVRTRSTLFPKGLR